MAVACVHFPGSRDDSGIFRSARLDAILTGILPVTGVVEKEVDHRCKEMAVRGLSILESLIAKVSFMK